MLNHKKVEHKKFMSVYRVYKDNTEVGITNGLADAAKLVGLSKSRAYFYMSHNKITSTGYKIVRDDNLIPVDKRDGNYYTHYDVYKNGELVAECVSWREACDMAGCSRRNLQHCIDNNRTTRSGYGFRKYRSITRN